MELTRQELLLMRALDGLASPTELAELQVGSDELAEWQRDRAILRAALTDPLGPPDLANDVMQGLGVSDSLEAMRRVCAVDIAHEAMRVEIVDDVMTQLELDDGIVPIRHNIQTAIMEEAGQLDVANAVMESLGEHSGEALGDLLRVGLEEGPSGDFAETVLSDLGVLDPSMQLSKVLQQEAVEARSQAPGIADAVMDQISGTATEHDSELGALLQAEAGAAPDLWAEIAAEIGVPVMANDETEAAKLHLLDDAVKAPGMKDRIRMPAVGFAAAAALLIGFSGMPSVQSDDDMIWGLSQVNEVEFEEINTDVDAVVQVWQFDENAPPIIYIDILETPESEGEFEGGTQL